MTNKNILVWLPSPMGDAILCTPALRAIRRHFKNCRICFLGEETVRGILSPCSFNDTWLSSTQKGVLKTAAILRAHKFDYAILFKNSFASALAVFLAGIPARIGYARQARSVFLTERLRPAKLPDGSFRPMPMVDYYLAIASWLGADIENRKLELSIDTEDTKSMQNKLPEVVNPAGPLILLVPGGAFGPSKFWPAERFAQTADRLIGKYNATVVICAASNPVERRVAGEISSLSRHKLVNLADRPVSPGELKALVSAAGLVISNDTGPRHIAIALNRRVISLFGPNDPAWTDTGYENEIQITGHAPCAPCRRPVCKETEHYCMEAITTEMVSDAACKMLEGIDSEPVNSREKTDRCGSFFVDPAYKTAFDKLDLTSIEKVFAFNAGRDLVKENLPRYRGRLQFETNSPPAVLFLKRYDAPPVLVQLKNWLAHRSRKSFASFEVAAAKELSSAGINTPRTAACGELWGTVFEKRSFAITEKIADAESLERKLPDCFGSFPAPENIRLRKDFIMRAGVFVKKFHSTGFRHRDLYLSHIFYGRDGRFYLIDLARAFKPTILAERFRIKDIAQLYYSAPGGIFSRTDRMRFYFSLTGTKRLTSRDKAFIHRVLSKAEKIAAHDIKHNRPVPFKSIIMPI